MTISLSKMDFLYANSIFAVQNEGTYLPRITRETCTLFGLQAQDNVTRLEGEKVRLETDLKRLENEFRELKEQFHISREEKRKLSKEVVLKTSRLATLENQVCFLRFKAVWFVKKQTKTEVLVKRSSFLVFNRLKIIRNIRISTIC